MAIAVALDNGAGNKTASASIQVTLSGNFSVGDIVLVGVTADNAGTSGVSAISSVQDSKGNTYSQVYLKNQTPGNAANDGCTIALYQAVVSVALVGGADTVTANFSPNVTAKTIDVLKMTGADAANFGTGTNSGAGTTYSVAASPSLVSGEAIIAYAGNESATAPTGDTDTSNGSWVNSGSNTTGGSGGDGTKVANLSQWKIVTGSGTQTLNGSTGANTDWAAGYAVYHVVAVAPARVPYMNQMSQLLAQ